MVRRSVPFFSVWKAKGGEGSQTGVAIDLGHGVFPHPPGIPLRGAWLGGDLA